MQQIMVSRIRPLSWKIYVQGEAEAEHLGSLLDQAGIDATHPERDPAALIEPPVYAFVASPRAEVPLTKEELVAILKADARVEIAFDTS
jgi:hypothetical protein